MISKKITMHAGPAMSTDTACSSAVVATHLGLQHTASHGGSVLTAGVNLMLAETTTAAAHAAGATTRCCCLRCLSLHVQSVHIRHIQHCYWRTS